MSLITIIECTEFSEKDLDLFKSNQQILLDEKVIKIEENKYEPDEENTNSFQSYGIDPGDDLDDIDENSDNGIKSKMNYINKPEFIKTPS